MLVIYMVMVKKSGVEGPKSGDVESRVPCIGLFSWKECLTSDPRSKHPLGKNLIYKESPRVGEDRR